MNNPATPKTDKAGEMRLTVCGDEYSLRLSYRALRAVERQLGAGIMVLLTRIRDKDFRIEDITVVVREAIIGGGCRLKDAPSEEDVGDFIMQTGMEKFIGSYAELLSSSVSAIRGVGKETSSGEAGAQTGR